MDHWRIPYLGQGHFPVDLTEFEFSTFFSFSPSERELIANRRTDRYRLGFALHLGFLRMTGRTLDACKQVPAAVWKHLCAQLDIDPPDIGTLRSLYDNRANTLLDHQHLAYQTLGFSVLTEHRRRYLVRWIKETLTGRPGIPALLDQVKVWLYEHRILIPNVRTLRRIVKEAVQAHEATLVDLVVEFFGKECLEKWDTALTAKNPEKGVVQRWLWAVPLRQSTGQIAELFEKIEYLRLLFASRHWPQDINEALVRHYAKSCANRPPSVSKRIYKPRRYLETACFLRYALCAATDQVLHMLRRWIVEITGEASRQVDSGRRDAHAALEELASSVKTLAVDTTLEIGALRQALIQLADNAMAWPVKTRRELVRLQLMMKSHRARPLLRKLVILHFQAENRHPVIDALGVLRDVYASDAGSELPPDTLLPKLSRSWRQSFDCDDRAQALRAFEWATLFSLRIGLRNGTVFIDHSFGFRSRSTLLIPEADWRAKCNHYYGHLKLPQDPKIFVSRIVEHIDVGLERLAEAVQAGKVTVDGRGVHLPPLGPDEENADVQALRTALFVNRPVGQLPTILLDIDSQIRFSWLLLGREPHSRKELLLVYAAILAHGTSMSAADLSRMVPELSAEAIRQMMKMLSDERQLQQASSAILDFMHRHPIAAHWGRSDLASSDMMSLETTRTVWQARADPRRRTASVGVYTHVRDRWGIFYDQPILLKERQAGAAIEGILRQTRQADVAQLAVDTHGYTDFAMAVAKCLQFDLCPRLAHMRDRQLYVPLDHLVPAELESVVAGDIDIDAIAASYDEFVRLVASIQSGQCSAVQALQRYGSASSGYSVYAAGVSIGRLLRTVFLIDYFTNPAFRRELQHALNRGEAIHVVQRAIHVGKVPTELAKRPDRLSAVSSSLALLTNAVLAWNTHHMQHAADAIESMTGDTLLPDDLRRIAPTALEGINLRGTFDFPIDDYAMRLLPSTKRVSAFMAQGIFTA
ncbi:Tn3 family transposase [Noviherbaspirillum galbum]|uniref:Tn3 family transposase n=1 Tax=Noviherbaspirillum galbum TaxID=2709383 RepID=A0A6B3SKR5_9BURK|nr:Tn3 family transposase [Noviherbaspirillum galbum]NEX59945.1 Tn3 family transposase [Noviherbaspirillum galbum]